MKEVCRSDFTLHNYIHMSVPFYACRLNAFVMLRLVQIEHDREIFISLNVLNLVENNKISVFAAAAAFLFIMFLDRS